MMELEECRARIDRIDQDLARMLELRMTVVAAVAAYKEAHGMTVHDASREEAVLERIAASVDDQELVPYIREIYRCIMDESKKYENQRMER